MTDYVKWTDRLRQVKFDEVSRACFQNSLTLFGLKSPRYENETQPENEGEGDDFKKISEEDGDLKNFPICEKTIEVLLGRGIEKLFPI